MKNAHLIRKFAEGRAFKYRVEICRFLTICNVALRVFLPMVFDSSLLSTVEIEKITEADYGHSSG